MTTPVETITTTLAKLEFNLEEERAQAHDLRKRAMEADQHSALLLGAIEEHKAALARLNESDHDFQPPGRGA